MSRRIARSPLLWVGAAIGIVMAIARLVGGGGPVDAAIALAITVGYAFAVTALAGRSETAATLAGRPIDERWELINLEACSWAFGVSAVVVLGAFVVAEATGGAWLPYVLVAVVMAVSYVGSLAILSVRR